MAYKYKPLFGEGTPGCPIVITTDKLKPIIGEAGRIYFLIDTEQVQYWDEYTRSYKPFGGGGGEGGVISIAGINNFPSVGDPNYIYIDIRTKKQYAWVPGAPSTWRLHPKFVYSRDPQLPQKLPNFDSVILTFKNFERRVPIPANTDATHAFKAVEMTAKGFWSTELNVKSNDTAWGFGSRAFAFDPKGNRTPILPKNFLLEHYKYEEGPTEPPIPITPTPTDKTVKWLAFVPNYGVTPDSGDLAGKVTTGLYNYIYKYDPSLTGAYIQIGG